MDLEKIRQNSKHFQEELAAFNSKRKPPNTPTNAQRAARAEAAILAYIEQSGDDFKANGLDTWIADLLCDLRHLARLQGFEFRSKAGESSFEAECREDQDGRFKPRVGWYVEKKAGEP